MPGGRKTDGGTRGRGFRVLQRATSCHAFPFVRSVCACVCKGGGVNQLNLRTSEAESAGCERFGASLLPLQRKQTDKGGWHWGAKGGNCLYGPERPWSLLKKEPRCGPRLPPPPSSNLRSHLAIFRGRQFPLNFPGPLPSPRDFFDAHEGAALSMQAAPRSPSRTPRTDGSTRKWCPSRTAAQREGSPGSCR